MAQFKDIDNLEEYVEYVFTLPAHPPKSCPLILTGDEDCLNEGNVFKVLGRVFTLGIVHLFANQEGKIDFTQINEDHIKILHACFQASNFDFVLLESNSVNHHKAIPTGKPSILKIPKDGTKQDFFHIQFIPL